MNDQMCDKSARRWCARVGLLLTICVVLLTMVYQLWNYYFSLVSEMDQSSHYAPELSAMVEVCEQTVDPIWNVLDYAVGAQNVSCVLEPFQNRYYLDIVGTGHAFLNGSTLTIQPADACVSVAVWTFPW